MPDPLTVLPDAGESGRNGPGGVHGFVVAKERMAEGNGLRPGQLGSGFATTCQYQVRPGRRFEAVKVSTAFGGIWKGDGVEYGTFAATSRCGGIRVSR